MFGAASVKDQLSLLQALWVTYRHKVRPRLLEKTCLSWWCLWVVEIVTSLACSVEQYRVYEVEWLSQKFPMLLVISFCCEDSTPGQWCSFWPLITQDSPGCANIVIYAEEWGKEQHVWSVQRVIVWQSQAMLLLNPAIIYIWYYRANFKNRKTGSTVRPMVL